MIPFNVKKHSDIVITCAGEGGGDERTFHLHKFPLISKSVYFDEHIPDSGATPGAGPVEMVIKDFPGGPNAFEIVAKYCYGIDIELTVDNIAYVYCACRVLRVSDLEKSTEAFMAEVVLRDPAKAAVVLKAGTSITSMTDAMMEGLIGHCINAIASMFAPLPELHALPPECFSCIVRTAGDMDIPKRTLEAAVLGYTRERSGAGGGSDSDGGAAGVSLTVDEFLDVVKSPGRLDDMKHGEGLYGVLEALLRHFKGDAEAEALCKGLHELGFWVCLPHAVIERAYADRNIPDRYCTVALMAENRHLIKVNEQLAEQVEALSEALRQSAAAGGPGGAGGGTFAPQPPAPALSY